MLRPDDRQLLLEALRPPVGYKVDYVIAATFSLDLLALLTSTLAFSSFDWQDSEGRVAVDPLALLEAVRRHAERTAIFCQAGQIAVPKRREILYSHLEGIVFEVSPPKGSLAFHPKLWVLRLVGSDQSVRYRLLCPSRNLTFDRSWDTLLVLDGELVERQRVFDVNRPLSDFVAALPRLARRPLPTATAEMIHRIQLELRRVRFMPPPGFEGITFWPLGIGRTARWPFDGRIDRLLVMSPFISDGLLSRLSQAGRRDILISRLESLAATDPKALKQFGGVYAWSYEADAEAMDDEDPDAVAASPNLGLHAKLYVADEGWNARVWTGSANATEAAFGGNVEFLVELRGKKSQCGIEALLAPTRGAALSDMLREFRPATDIETPDAVQQEIEKLVGDLHRRIAREPLVARVAPTSSPKEYGLSIHQTEGIPFQVSDSLHVKCWPVTLPEGRAIPLSLDANAVPWNFGTVSFEALTAFFAFDVTATLSGRRACARFVLNLPLEGVPEDRHDRILRSLLGDRTKLLRFLLFLLGEGEPDGGEAPPPTGLVESGAKGSGTEAVGLPLFEAMVRVLDRDPQKLDQVARLVNDLRRSPDGRQLLPAGFDDIWEPIWAARARVRE